MRGDRITRRQAALSSALPLVAGLLLAVAGSAGAFATDESAESERTVIQTPRAIAAPAATITEAITR